MRSVGSNKIGIVFSPLGINYFLEKPLTVNLHVQNNIFIFQKENNNKKEYILLLESLGQAVKVSLPSEILKKV